ncbi:MAG: ABC transporter permease [Desulfovibrio sp.]|jgi:putative ABC transport system permease protein|nr:ABC transporter permease [Desulfovibrio sp.]
MLSIGLGIAVFIGVDVIGKELEDRIVSDVGLIGNVTILSVTMEENLYLNMPDHFFTNKTVKMFKSLPEVMYAGLSMRFVEIIQTQIKDTFVNIRIRGVDPFFWKVYDLIATEGRLLNEVDEKKRSRVCVLGKDLARNLFQDGPYIGRSVTLFSDNYTVVGIGGGLMMRSRTLDCLIPMTTASDRIPGNTYPNRLLLRLRRLDDVEAMIERLPELILSQQNTPYFKIEYAKDEIKAVRTIIGRVHVLLLLGIFASLGLGTFGIWQSSFAAVRERTREIGLQLAMGAEQNDIMRQFLGEALFNALLGGAIGTLVGIIAILVLCVSLGMPISWASIVLHVPVCLLAASCIGAAGGTWPAIQAGRMDVAAALRYE